MNTITLHPWIGSNPEQFVENLEARALKWNIIVITTAVAIGAISVFVMVSSFFLNVPASITFFCIVLTPILSYAGSHFQSKYQQYQEIINSEKPVALEFQKIKNWDEEKIKQFLQEHQISLEPTASLLPLIARFNARITQAQVAKNDSKKLTTYVPDITTRTWQRNKAWTYLEEVAIPAMLEAAFVLYILRNPNQTTFFEDHFEITQKTFEQRAFDLKYDQNDDYLRSKSGMTLSFSSLSEISDVSSLYQILYQ